MYKAIIGKNIFQLDSKEITEIDGKPFPADVIEYSNGKFHILLNNRSYNAEILSHDKETKSFSILVGKSVINVQLKDRYDELLLQMGIDETSSKKVNNIVAPMPGMVLQVMVENNQEIKKGDAIVVLEAMKMENILKAPGDGIVKKIHVIKGDKVEKNQVMVNLF